MGVPQEKIQEIRDRIDIERVVARAVKLTRRGKRATGLCPFHKEKSPSFSVDTEKKLYHCFGCQVGGDVFDFVMRIEGCDFREAVMQLAREAGVVIEDKEEDPQQREARQWRERLYALNAAASSFFQAALRREPRALAYLREERGLSDETIERFQLGWAPADWHALADHLSAKHHDLKQAALLGLVSFRPSDGKPYDRLRGRVVFPIVVPGGEVAGFGARRADWIEEPAGENKSPKYLNSPESPIYDKSSILYGLSAARDEIRRSKRAVLVEGYVDVIGLHQGGVAQAVAACGTALSPRHGAMISRLATEVVEMYDGDAAGQDAARKSALSLLSEGLTVRIAELPPGEDPDDFVRRHGREATEHLIQSAPSAVDYFVAQARAVAKGGGIAGMAKAVDSVKPLLLAVKDPLARDVGIDATARALGVEPAMLRRHLTDRRTDRPPTPPPRAETPPAAPPSAKVRRAPAPVVEMALLKMFLETPDPVLSELEAREALRAFSHPAIQAAFDAGIHAHREGQAFDAPRALEAAQATGTLDEGGLAALRKTLVEALPERDDVSVCVKRLLRDRNAIRLRHLRQQLARETDPDLALELAKEADALSRIMASLT